MALVPFLEEDPIPTKNTYDTARKVVGRVLNFHKVVAHSPRVPRRIRDAQRGAQGDEAASHAAGAGVSEDRPTEPVPVLNHPAHRPRSEGRAHDVAARAAGDSRGPSRRVQRARASGHPVRRAAHHHRRDRRGARRPAPEAPVGPRAGGARGDRRHRERHDAHLQRAEDRRGLTATGGRPKRCAVNRAALRAL